MNPALLAGAAALALGTAPLAAAALTAEQAWQNMQDAAAEADITLTAQSVARTGAQLAVTGVAFSAALPEDGNEADAAPGTVSGTIAEMVFAEQDDGTVDIAVTPEIPVAVAFEDDDGAPVTLDFLVSHDALAITAGDAEGGGTTLDYAADAIRAALADVTSEAAEDVSYDVTFSATDLSSSNTYRDAGSPEIATETTAGALALRVSVADADSPATFDMTMALSDLSSRSEGSGSFLLSSQGDLSALAAPGFASEGAGGVSGLTLQLAGTDEEGVPFDFGLTTGPIAGTGRVAEGQMAYDVSYEGVVFALAGGGMPVPQVTGALGGLDTGFAMPLRPSETAQPVALNVEMTELALGEGLWAMFDPAGVLPRDPATFIADLTGLARWRVDPADEAAMEAAAEAEEIPFELQRLDIDALRLSLSGADLSGTGGLALDWSQEGPFGPGSPVPDGGLSLVLTGGQALIDNLVRMGLLTQENAMMTRMMLGAIARPGEGADTLVSEITLRPDGTVLANGAPLPF